MDDRQQFEAWCTKRWGGLVEGDFHRKENGEYGSPNLQFALGAWQASRAAMVPLTEAQIKLLLTGAVRLPQGWKQFARDLEAAHGIGAKP